MAWFSIAQHHKSEPNCWLTRRDVTPAVLMARAHSAAALRASASVWAVTVSVCQQSATAGVGAVAVASVMAAAGSGHDKGV